MSVGYIALHRKLLDSPCFDNPDVLKLWLYILIKANHKDKQKVIGTRAISIQRGSFMTSRISLSRDLDYTESKIERMLKLLEELGQIGQQTDRKFRIISVVNYEQYQKTEQQTDNKRTTNEQQMDTTNNVNNDKNGNKIEMGGVLITPEMEKDFQNFFVLYALKEKEPEVRKAYIAAREYADHETITNGVREYRAAIAKSGQNIQGADKWLAGHRWKDDFSAIASRSFNSQTKGTDQRRSSASVTRDAAAALIREEEMGGNW